MAIESKSTGSSSADKVGKKIKVGIPRGLFYFKYGAMWTEFLKKLGCEVVFSSATTSKIVDQGAKEALSELCVPMKIYFGHIMALEEEYDDLDYIFVPRYVSIEKQKYFCPKFMILPEAVKYGLKPKTELLTLQQDTNKETAMESAIALGRKLGVKNQEEAGKAWYFAIQELKKFKSKLRSGISPIEILNKLDENPKHKAAVKVLKSKVPEQTRGKFMINIMVIGHAYNVYESHINMDLINRLAMMDANVLTMEKLPKEVFDEPIIINKQYENYWDHEEEILQTARYYLRQGNIEKDKQIDGIIFLISFACGPDSLIQELLMRDMKKRKIPYLDLILDEHSGEAGLATRVESFVDMIRRKKYAPTEGDK